MTNRAWRSMTCLYSNLAGHALDGDNRLATKYACEYLLIFNKTICDSMQNAGLILILAYETVSAV